MQALLDQANEQRIHLQKIVTRRKELEKLVELKEQKLQEAKERNRVPEIQTEAQAFRILQCVENHKQEVAKLETLHNELEGLAMLNIQAKDRQKVRLMAHQTVMKELAQKFQSGPQTYMNQNEMREKLGHLDKEHQVMQQNLASILQEQVRKESTYHQLFPVDAIKSNTIAVDGNMAVIMQKMSKHKKLELKQSKAKELDLQKKLNNLQQLNSLLQTDLTRLEAKMAN